MTDTDLANFARAAELEPDEADDLLHIGAALGLKPEILACLGAMAPQVVEIQRQFILDGILSQPGRRGTLRHNERESHVEE